MATRREIEIAFTAKDETTAQINRLNQELAKVQQAGGQTGAAFDRLNKQTLSASQQISALGATTRFAASSMVSDLSPALGTTVTRIASLGTVANTTGDLISGVLVGGGIAIATLALAELITAIRDAGKELEDFNRIIVGSDLDAFAKQIEALNQKLRDTQREGLRAHLVMEGMSETFDFTEERVRELTGQLGPLGLEYVALLQAQGEAERGSRRIAEEFGKTGKAFEEARRKVEDFTDAIAQTELREVEQFATAMERLRISADDLSFAAATDELKEFDRTAAAIASKLRDIQEEFGEAGFLGAVQALGPAIDDNVIAKLQEIEDPAIRTLRVVQDEFREAQRSAEEFARRSASFISSTLFDALEGRIEDFGDFFKRSLINLSRELVESQLFSLIRPGGGGFRPFEAIGGFLGIGGQIGAPAAPSVLQAATPLPPGLAGGGAATAGGLATAGLIAAGIPLLTFGLVSLVTGGPSAHEQNVQDVNESVGRIEFMVNNPNVQRLLEERPALADLIEELVRIRNVINFVPGSVSRGAVELLRAFLPRVEEALAALSSGAIGPEELFRRLADAMGGIGFSTVGAKTGRVTSLQLGQAFAAAASEFPILARLATEGPQGLIADEQRRLELAEMQRKIDELATELQEVRTIAEENLQVGSGLLGRTIQGLTAYDRLRILEQEIGLLVDQRQGIVEAMG